jgi:hypothetical protein
MPMIDCAVSRADQAFGPARLVAQFNTRVSRRNTEGADTCLTDAQLRALSGHYTWQWRKSEGDSNWCKAKRDPNHIDNDLRRDQRCTRAALDERELSRSVDMYDEYSRQQ